MFIMRQLATGMLIF